MLDDGGVERAGSLPAITARRNDRRLRQALPPARRRAAALSARQDAERHDDRQRPERFHVTRY